MVKPGGKRLSPAWPDLACYGLLSMLTVAALFPLIRCLDSCYSAGYALGPSNPKIDALNVIDVRFTTWIVAWVQHALLTQPLHLFDANIFYPAPNMLAGSENMIGVALQVLPLRLISDNAVAIHQSALLLAVLVLSWTTFAFTRWVSGSRPAALIAGAASIFMPWHINQMGHLQLISAQWFPAIWLYAGRIAIGEERRGDMWLLCPVLALQLLSSFYLAYFVFYSTALLLLALALARRVSGRGILRVLGACCLPTLVLGLVSIPYLVHKSVNGMDTPAMTVRSLGSAWANLAPPALDFAGPAAGQFQVTWPILLLCVTGSILLWRNGREHRTAPDRIGPFVFGLWLVVAGAFVMSIGSQIQVAGLELSTPYEWASHLVPGFENLRGLDRWGLIWCLAFPPLAGLAIASFADSTPGNDARKARRRSLVVHVGTALLLLIGTRWQRIETESAFEPIEDTLVAYRMLQLLPAGPVVEIPWHLSPVADAAEGSRAALGSTLHWRPVLNGFTAYRPRSYALVRQIAARMPAPEAVDKVQRLTGLRWIILHKTKVMGWVKRRWVPLPSGSTLRVAYRDPAVNIYEVPPNELAGSLIDKLNSTKPGRETLFGISRAPLKRSAKGKLMAMIPPRIVLPRATDPDLPGTTPVVTQRIFARVINSGGTPWPGVDLYDQGLVRIRYTLSSVDSSEQILQGLLPLAADLPPGADMEQSLRIPIRAVPGTYLLKLDLVQQLGEKSVALPTRAAQRIIEVSLPVESST